MEPIDQLNYLSIEVLDKLGNPKPSEAQIELMELLISSSATKQKYKFAQPLTHKEASCLFWAAHGMSAVKTANLLNVSQSTIETHRKEIKRKLNCANMAQAVYQGIMFKSS